MLNDSPQNIFLIVFLAVTSVGVFCFYVLFYRGVMLKKKLRTLFNVQQFEKGSEGSYFQQSPYMLHEGGYVLYSFKIDDFDEILIYQFIVGGQINMRRYLVHIQSGANSDDSLYGSGHIARECRAHRLYDNYRSITELPNQIDFLDHAGEAIEVYNGVSYAYYKLGSFFGYFPISDLYLMIVDKIRGRHRK